MNDYTIHISFDFSKIDLNNVGNFLSKENYFYNTLLSGLNEQHFSNIQVYFQTAGAFYYIQEEIQSIEINFIIEVFPILILSLFIAQYSFGLIYNSIVRNISIYKTRGASAWIIFFFQVIDNLVIIGISIFLSLLFGIPLSVISLKSNYLLSFDTPSPNLYLFNIQSVIIVLLLWAVFLIIVINLNRVRKLSKMSIVESENLTEQGNPFWKRHYFDILLMVFGSFMLSIYYFIMHNPNFLQNIAAVAFILILLIIPSPFAFVIGLILFISRFVPIFLNKISSILWFFTGGLTAYSFKNILRYKNATIRAILLTSMVMAFLIVLYAQPYTMLDNYKETTYFQAGADGTLAFSNESINLSTIQLLQKDFPQYIDSLSPFILLTSVNLDYQRIEFLLVNTSSYIQSSNLNFDLGLNNSLKNDFANLTVPKNCTSLTPIAILLDQNAVKQRNAKIGDNITVTETYNNNFQRFRIIDSFKHWPFINYGPNTIYNSRNFLFQNYYAIGDINYFLNSLHGNISNSIFSYVNEAGLFINFKQNINLTLAVSQIENLAHGEFLFVPKLDIQQYASNFSFLFITGQVNLNVLISLFVIVIIFILFIQFQFSERNREIYTERAIGMKLNQISFIFYVENLTLVAISLLIGFVVGILLINLLDVITSNPFQTYPPYTTIIPFGLVFLTNIAIFVMAGIISIVPSLFVLKQDISDSFAKEF